MNIPLVLEQPKVTASVHGSEMRLTFSGDWTVQRAAEAERLLAGVADRDAGSVVLDLSAVTALDTAGAWLVVRLRDALTAKGRSAAIEGYDDSYTPLFDEVEEHKPHDIAEALPRRGIVAGVEKVGRRTVDVWHDAVDLVAILGQFASGLSACLVNVTRMRGIAVLHHFDQTGRTAVPIIALMSFLIGGIIAQQGAFYLRQFGADQFVVDLVGVLVLREIGVLLTAIMVAGRSGSAFTAEIGSMKMREEIDAMHVIGLRPVEVLVVPRLTALMIALPILAFIADVSALAGAGLVSWAYLGLTPQAFVIRLQEAIDLQTLYIGIVKAPVMALIIGLISCAEGLKVAGSAESLGRQTTVAVVKAIFMVIVVDGLFAVFFAAINI
ncbi:phospholipid/cholesterol/gamma-HCH transport system permease protein [Rhodobium orientis]|nr:ABC transporter permease [Rhodobium orientis]MBB4303107.1 phospholipid/cholesterol/gamma-HCH transport system permease protein [Rhodobium orientis]